MSALNKKFHKGIKDLEGFSEQSYQNNSLNRVEEYVEAVDSFLDEPLVENDSRLDIIYANYYKKDISAYETAEFFNSL